MEDEVEDVVGDVKYTDSQKSVTTSNAYSPDFTDSSSDKNISSGKETYVIEQSDTDSEQTYQIHSDESILNLNNKLEKHDVKYIPQLVKINKSACTSLQRCTILGEEMFTQTSKTIFELMRNEMFIRDNAGCNTLATQTSFSSVTGERVVEYRIQVTENKSNNDINPDINYRADVLTNSEIFIESLKEKSLIFENSETKKISSNCCANDNFKADCIAINNDEMKYTASSELYNENTSDVELANINSDLEEDSLMENEYQKCIPEQDNSSEISNSPDSFENDVDQLYQHITANTLESQPMTTLDSAKLNFEILTPLTEETNKNGSILDCTPSISTLAKNKDDIKRYETIRNNFRMRTLKNDYKNKGDMLKLPPIFKNQSCPNSPVVNSLFSVHTPQTPFVKSEGFPNVFEGQQIVDTWDSGSKNLASGEKPDKNIKNDTNRKTNLIQLPPIDVFSDRYKKVQSCLSNSDKPLMLHKEQEISIQGRIKNLKMNDTKARSCSPSISTSSPGDSKLCDVAEKGCDALCCQLLRQLRSSSWTEVAETLEYLPNTLKNFWPVISELRIADLLRQLTALVESPRTKVARTACDAIAQLLKNTSYIRKPDFFEAVSILLTKTSSFSRPVRRAANVALDDIVCHIELTHAVTAICLYGIEHKSPLVRCASSRLLVVCCALAEGGRRLLRSRPPTASAARRHVLQALSLLIQDKNLETRKYAERLYAMLRPLPNFEAYFLTDVDVDLAASQMKKYDAMLHVKEQR